MRKTSVYTLGLAVALVGLLAGPAAAAAETFKERFEQSYPLAAGGAFTLKDVNGAVSITAWDRNEVHVVAEKEVKAGSAEEGRKRLAELKIDVAAKAGDVRIDTRFPKQNGDGLFGWLSGNSGSASVSYTIEAPKGVRVDVRTVNGALSVRGTAGDLRAETTNGAVSVSGLQGKLHLESTNGAISAVDTVGTVVAETTNGRIDVDLKVVPKGGEMSLSTTNGGIHLKVPHDLQASISASTTNGHVSTDLPIQARTSSKRHLEGDVNGGGGKLQLSTTNGSIEIDARQ